MDIAKAKPTSYTYGPVPSRRLGLSLGIDIVPPKFCTLDCVYCQIGRTTRRSTVRQDFLDIQAVLTELREKLAAGLKADYLTIGGSGEPTLNSRLGDLIDGIRRLTDIPVAILTNGTLLYREDVRAECAKADVVIPTLDAADAAVFEAVHRPAADITIEKLVSGLEQFRAEFQGEIWLEVFLVAGVNTQAGQIEKLKTLIQRIRPDKVHLNTAVRPPAEPDVRAVPAEMLDEIAHRIGGHCEVIGAPPAAGMGPCRARAESDILSVLKRRPCSVADIATGLAMPRDEVTKYLTALQDRGVITAERRGDILYFQMRSQTP
ncbi:MAG: radical SAM protein [Planctomycetes bacterium]|jgi:wyosine [tRNA(Phe)-imidazoG37] synthetase (radical SAM superfamily)|nr:radical SAM protein [Planctomycetota bacterium]